MSKSDDFWLSGNPITFVLQHAIKRNTPMTGIQGERLTARLNVAVTREVFIPASIHDVFEFVAAENVVPLILTGYGLVPGVASASDVSASWDQPGAHRVVHLADGSTVDEGVTAYARPSNFAYRVSNPSFTLRHLMVEASGKFWFAPAGTRTQVRWTYTFHAKNRLAKLPLLPFVKSQWRGYMDVCLRNISKHFEASNEVLTLAPILECAPATSAARLPAFRERAECQERHSRHCSSTRRSC